jgi:hypothetical protein
MIKYHGTNLLDLTTLNIRTKVIDKDIMYTKMYDIGQKVVVDIYRRGVTPYHDILMLLE